MSKRIQDVEAYVTQENTAEIGGETTEIMQATVVSGYSVTTIHLHHSPDAFQNGERITIELPVPILPTNFGPGPVPPSQEVQEHNATLNGVAQIDD